MTRLSALLREAADIIGMGSVETHRLTFDELHAEAERLDAGHPTQATGYYARGLHEGWLAACGGEVEG